MSGHTTWPPLSSFLKPDLKTQLRCWIGYTGFKELLTKGVISPEASKAGKRREELVSAGDTPLIKNIWEGFGMGNKEMPGFKKQVF